MELIEFLQQIRAEVQAGPRPDPEAAGHPAQALRLAVQKTRKRLNGRERAEP